MDEFVTRTFNGDEFPEGLRCFDCQRLFIEGQPISERLYAMGEYADEPLACVELICAECSFGSTQPKRQIVPLYDENLNYIGDDGDE